MQSMRLTRLFAVALAFALAVLSCKSTPEVNPYAAAGESETDLLDQKVQADDSDVRPERQWNSRIDMNLPDPPEEMAHTIDGKSGDWSAEKVKSFRNDRHVTDGEQFWDGASDSSVSVAADADRGHLYFSMNVRDDTVIDAESVDPFADGVVLWLRDPRLAKMRANLPDPLVESSDLHSDIGILFTPDGQFWLYDEEAAGADDQTGNAVDRARELYRQGIRAATVQTDRGYRVEVALKLGTIRQVASIPVPDVAFRVEVIDGDERDRRGEQTTFNTMPSLEDGRERFALLDLEGWLPYASLGRTPPREGALGRWEMNNGTWRFEAFETPPRYRRRLEDTAGFADRLAGTPFDAICSQARKETEVVSAWETKDRTHRSALVLCGTRAPEGTCPDDAATDLYHVRLISSPNGWSWDRAVRINPEPLNQCPQSAPQGKRHYERFAFLPLPMVGSPIWAVGWQQTGAHEGEQFRRSGVWFVNTRSGEAVAKAGANGDDPDAARIGAAQLSKITADTGGRVRSTSLVYLADVDRTQGLDVCEIETIREQECRGLNRGCYTPQRGTEKIAHIKMWKPSEERFERFVMSKHRNCSTAFDFGARQEAYLLLQRGSRLGVVRSPKPDSGN